MQTAIRKYIGEGRDVGDRKGPGDLATGPNLARKPYYYGLAIVARSLRGCESSWSTLRWRKLLDLTNETAPGRTRGHN